MISSTFPFSCIGLVIRSGDIGGEPRGRVVMGRVWPVASLPFLRGGISGVILCSDRRCFVSASDLVNVFPQSEIKHGPLGRIKCKTYQPLGMYMVVLPYGLDSA
jgi:hypothetical protein